MTSKKIIDYYLVCSATIKRKHIINGIDNKDLIDSLLIANKKLVYEDNLGIVHVRESIIGGNDNFKIIML